MKVALLTPIPFHFYDRQQSGSDHSATWIVLLVDALLEHGIETHVVTQGSPNNDRWKRFIIPRAAGSVTVWAVEVRAHRKIITDYRQERRRFNACLNEITPDVVHGHGTEVLYSRCAVESGFPHVISLQTVMHWLAKVRKTDLLSWYAAFHEANTVRQAQRVIVKTEFSRHMMQPYLAGKPVHLIPNAIHPDFLAAGEKRQLREDYVVFVGSIRPDKGIYDLVRAMAITTARKTRLIICGYGTAEHESKLHDLVQQGQLQDRVDLVGQLDHAPLADVVSRARALVLPTHCDNSPNVVWESIAAGTPVIATNVGGVPEMIEEGRTGRLIEPRDVEHLAQLISLPIQELVSTSLDERLDIARELSKRQSLESTAIAHIDVYKQAVADHV